jgi:putative FmdB family regulatory protein
MPLFEYKCECGKTIEKINKFDVDKIKCECGKIAKRTISMSTFHLKGGGWYDSGYSKNV